MAAGQTITRTIASTEAHRLPLHLLRCPVTGAALSHDGAHLRATGGLLYPINAVGTPIFAECNLADDARRQQAHYDSIAQAYEDNLGYPHTRAYFDYLDGELLSTVGATPLGVMAEICCGTGFATKMFTDRYEQAIGVDISAAMLERATRENSGKHVTFVQGDATRLPLADAAFDTVVMLGGIHHINDRAGLFGEVARILKPGGRFIFREPVSDFVLWRWLRAVIYRLSPMLDYSTERPLLLRETIPVLEAAGLTVRHWSTHGFFGFCVFMNSDVLVVTRLFRFVPGISAITRAATKFDAWVLRLPGMQHAGLQVIGLAQKSG